MMIQVLAGLLLTNNAFADPLTDAQAMEVDAAWIAADRDWNEEETLDFLYEQRDFDALVETIEATYPSSYSDAENLPGPGGTGKIYFKGTVPSGVAALITSSGVSASAYGGANQTAIEIDAHADDVADFLEGEGYTDFAVGTRVNGVIEVTIGAGADEPDFPVAMDYGLVVNVIASSTTVLYIDSLGGTLAIGDGCTMGFSVKQVAGELEGITTAGHCDNAAITDTLTPLGAGLLVSPLEFEDEHEGQWGDMQWHSTTDDVDIDDFWYDDIAGAFRDVVAVEGTITRNTWYCSFGRANGNTCDSVRDPNQRAGGLRRLVQMDRARRAGGDSGGPWFRGGRAVGITTGATKNAFGTLRDVFSRAEYFDEGMGVVVKTL